MASVSVFESLSECLSEIRRLGSVLCGDTVGDGLPWQTVAISQAAELRFYATMLERAAFGKEGGGVVFPSWDAEGVDGEGGGVFTEMAAVPMPPESVAGVPKSGVMPEWCQEDIAESMAGGATANAALRAGEIYRRYLELKGALATALMRLNEGAEMLDRVAGRLGTGAVPLEVAAGMREAYAAGIDAIEGARRKS